MPLTNSSSTSLLHSIALLLGFATISQTVEGQTFTSWKPGVTGSWFDSGNWSAGVPLVSSTASIDEGGTAQINTGGIAVTHDLDIGNNLGAGTLQITNGSLQVSGSTFLGLSEGGASGTLLVSGSTASLYQADAQFVSIGDGAAGTLTVRDGALVSVNRKTDLGRRAGSSGTLNLEGTAGKRGVLETHYLSEGSGSGVVNFDGGILRALSNQSNLTQGFETGDVRINSGGGYIDSNGFSIGIVTALQGTGALTKLGAGTLTLNGANTYAGGTTISRGTLAVDGGSISHSGAAANMIIGDATGDNGTLLLQNNGSVTVGGFTSVANATGSQGSLSISSGTYSNTGNISIGGRGTGTVTVSGGSVSGLSYYIGDQLGGNGTLNASGGTVQTPGQIFIGHNGEGLMTVAVGASVVVGGYSTVGNSAGSEGTLNMTGGTYSNVGNFAVGTHGTGNVSISGGTLSAAGFYIGDLGGGVGNVNITGGTLQAANEVNVGFSGTGTLALNRGQVNTPTLYIGRNSGSNGTVTLGGTVTGRGLLQTGQIARVSGSGSLSFDGGVLRATRNNTNYLSGFAAGNLQIQAGGAYIDSNGFAITIQTPLQGVGGLTKQGTSSLTLSGSHNYTGPTTIENGTLRIRNNTGFNSAITINQGASLELDIANDVKLLKGIAGPGSIDVVGAATTARLAGDNSGFTGTFTLPLGSRGMMWSSVNAGSSAAKWDLSGAFAVIETGVGDSIVKLGELRGASGTTELSAFEGSGKKTFEVGALGTNSTFAGKIQNATTGTATVAITKVGAGELILTNANTYTGGTSVSGGSLVATNNGALGLGAVTITNNSDLRAGIGVTVPNALTVGTGGGRLSNYGSNAESTFSGSITLGGDLFVVPLSEASASLTLSGNIAGSGSVFIQSDQEAEVNISGASMNPVGGIFNQSSSTGDVTISAAIGGNVTGVTQDSATARLILSGNNTYTGETTVSQGTLLVTGSIAGTTTVQSAGALGGSGVVMGETTVAGKLAPGDGEGLLTFGGDLTLQLGSVTAMELGGLSLNNFDRVSVDDALVYGGTLLLSLMDGYFPALGDSFPLFQNFNSQSGTFSNVSFSNPQVVGDFDYATGTLEIVAVPEPATGVLTVACLLGLFGGRGRFRSRRDV